MSVFPILSTKQFDVTVVLDPSPNNSYTFTNFNRLKGKIQLKPLKKNLSEISKIQLTFEGFSKSILPDDHLKAAPDFSRQLYGTPAINKEQLIKNPFLHSDFNFLESNLNIECHRLVHEAQDLFNNDQNDQTFHQNQLYEFPFNIMIPAETQCCLEDHDICHQETIFHIDSLTNCKVPIKKHKKNLYINRSDVLRHPLPPSMANNSTSSENRKRRSAFDGLFNVFYYLQVNVQTIVSKKLSNNKSIKSNFGYHEISFVPREFSVDIWNREKRSMKIVYNRSNRLFNTKLGDLKYALLNNEKSSNENNLSFKFSKFKNDHNSNMNTSKQKELLKRSTNELLYLEARLYNSDHYQPGESPNLKLFLVSLKNPNEITNLSEDHEKIIGFSLQNLEIDVVETTRLQNQPSVDIDQNSIPNSRIFRTMKQNQNLSLTDLFTRRVNLFKSSKTLNYRIPLRYTPPPSRDHKDVSLNELNEDELITKFVRNNQRISSETQEPIYEYEIPLKNFRDDNDETANLQIPDNLIPSFISCNIKRDYKIGVRSSINTVLASDLPSISNGLSSKFSLKSRSTEQQQSSTQCNFDFKIKILSGVSSIIDDIEINPPEQISQKELLEVGPNLVTQPPTYDDIFETNQSNSSSSSLPSLEDLSSEEEDQHNIELPIMMPLHPPAFIDAVNTNCDLSLPLQNNHLMIL